MTSVGDPGDRYEVRYTDALGMDHVFGYSDTYTGALHYEGQIQRHPQMFRPRIIDRLASRTRP